MKSITVRFNDKLMNEIKKRAEKSFLSVHELVEDIVRRSMVSYEGGGAQKPLKIDDRLVAVFSRERKGRKKLRKVKKKK